MSATHLSPVTPGEILLEEFLKPMGISQNALGLSLRVPPQRINEIVRGRRPITLDTALRLATFFGTSPEFWLNLQMEHDLRKARRDKQDQRIREEIGGRRAVDMGVEGFLGQ